MTALVRSDLVEHYEFLPSSVQIIPFFEHCTDRCFCHGDRGARGAFGLGGKNAGSRPAEDAASRMMAHLGDAITLERHVDGHAIAAEWIVGCRACVVRFESAGVRCVSRKGKQGVRV